MNFSYFLYKQIFHGLMLSPIDDELFQNNDDLWPHLRHVMSIEVLNTKTHTSHMAENHRENPQVPGG